ncbi:MAG: DUF192 domain-containing protein [Candidatus Sulfomarinibacteraceae bacterium]
MTTVSRAPMPEPARVAVLTVSITVLLLVGAGCSPAPPADESTAAAADAVAAPSETPPKPPNPTAVFPDGFSATIELAITPDELAQGLMFRPSLPDDRGMLLIFSEERLPNIWMMNTLVALDLVYLDRTGRVVDVITDAQPCPGEPCPRFTPKLPAQAVLEIPAGAAGAHAITEGSVIEFTHVPGFPVTTPATN